ncbi:asparagine synthase (glutamine-hydrolyzing) [Leifsonia sp. ZF2019]|uniref:asparagine synthase (glutamine-hydrolyzing) n=1 Tax=Leifsonia sp. ZF2019 TaxID=2781978 RepID=UPI001CBEEA53|nr:asparagine synthase (glutamine-hydrolyzing) [Leifsonia sp. ZF2019]UAJ78965.1 asparagine synthase (glutamine-hydrolyzing) [Leifsonia sp. ZF2019]
MCGIAGIHRLDGTGVDPALLHAMADRLGHRGPDDRGVWTHGAAGFAHTRLSIIDLHGSRQPMTSADGRFTLAFNGEIFNYRRLREDLQYPFTTDGDTEVILAGIAQRGIGFIDRLVGQFAFALHDSATGITHLVRDRLGVLPLYYTHGDGAVVFASEVKAILPALPRTPSVDLASLDSYLYGRSVPAPDTLYEGIHKLRPGHRAEVHPDGRLEVLRYWQPPTEDNTPRWTEQSAVDAVDVAVTQAVDAALVADVPVGAYLSGGVDSSLIVAKVAALRPGRTVHTFAAGFGDKRNDELGWARIVADAFETEHHEVHVDASDFEDLWPRLTYFRDAPLSEPADIAVFRLAEAARTTVRVILSGEGGDELFAGYPKYRAARAVQLASHLPAGLRASLANSIDPRLPARLGRARIALRVAAMRNAEDRYRTWFAPFTASERAQLLTGLPRRTAQLPDTNSDDVIRAMLLTDLWSWLPDNLLERGDRMSMAASLELRPPLLDHRLVELAFRMPSAFKVRHGSTKWLLKEVARRYVPSEVIDRKKVGFRVPLDSWFRGGLREAMWDRLTGPGSFVGETFDRTAVQNLLTRHESGAFNEENRIFTLMSLEVWHEAAFGRTAAPAH